jgi:hypothetical protein
MMFSKETLEACEGAIELLTGEKIKRGDTGWLEVMMRALLMGATYKSLWENKHGEVQHIAPTRDDQAPGDGSRGATEGAGGLHSRDGRERSAAPA